MGRAEMGQIGEWIHQVLLHPDSEDRLRQVRSEVVALTQKFPIPQ